MEKYLLKKKKDLPTSDLKPVGDISIPILKLFYDSNGYLSFSLNLI